MNPPTPGPAIQRLTLPPKPAAGFHPELQFTRSDRDNNNGASA